MSHIIKIVPLADYRLEVQMDNGSSVTLNLESRLETVRFGKLTDKAFFDSATTDGSFIRWEDKIEIALSELFQLIQK